MPSIRPGWQSAEITHEKTFVADLASEKLKPFAVEDFLSWLRDQAVLERLDDNGLDGAVSHFRSVHRAATAPTKDSVEMAAIAASAQQQRESLSDRVADVYPLQQLAEAEEREDTLLAHLRANEPYYRYALWNAMDPGSRLHHLTMLGQFTQIVSPEAIAFVGDQLAFPLDSSRDDEVQSWLEQHVARNDELVATSASRTVTLSTGNVRLEAGLGACNACEDYVTRLRDLELELKTAQVAGAQWVAAQEQIEADRRSARLAQVPPLLDDPRRSDASIRVTLEQPSP